ncbi:MAG: glycosyltransferase [Patescibacteria group bacterium]|nr:glycosyltransferase [Patescibacteria group bacterium]
MQKKKVLELRVDNGFYIDYWRSRGISDLTGIDITSKSVKELTKKYHIAKLIIGNGPFKNNLEQQVKKLNLENNIISVDGIPNSELPRYYATADIFINPTLCEGFGLVFVEALLCKCCVISSDLKTISDIVKNEETGIQVDVKNTKLFADKIIDL